MKDRCLSLGLVLWAAGVFAADFPPLVLPEGVGVNIHFTRGHEADLDLIAAGGFKFIRMDFGWGGIERKRGEYNWADYEELTANLEKRRLRPIYILDYSNGLYEETTVARDPISGRERRDVASPQKPESVAAFARWAGAAAAHFKGRGVIWEIWNEPNISFWKPKPDVKQYIALVLATGRAIRQADPAATLVAPASSEFPWAFLEELLSAPGVLELLDGISVHPYRSYNRGPETAGPDYARLRGLIERYAPPQKKTMPILSGEWGYASHSKGVSLDVQAAFIARQQLHNLLCGVPVSIWYDWKNDGLDPNYNEHNFGTVSNNLAPKPAYLAVQTLTRQLAGYRVARRLATPGRDDFVLLLVNAAGDQRLAAWTTGAPHSLALDLDASAKDVLCSDGQGRPKSVSDQNGAVALALDPAPQYLTLRKRSLRLSVESSWRHAAWPPTLVEASHGAGTPLALQITNPLPSPVLIQLNLRWPGGSERADLELAPGQGGSTTLRLRPTMRNPAKFDAALSLEFSERNGAVSRPLGRSSESLEFTLSNPLTPTLAPAQGGLWLLVENPARTRFDGFARVNDARLPLRMDGASAETVLPVPHKPAGSAASVQLTDVQGQAITESARFAFRPLPPLKFQGHLDGDSKVPAQASLAETNPPPGRHAPFARVWRLDYQFDAGWRFVRCAPASKEPVTIPPGTTALGLWVCGDRSGNLLRMRLTDTGGQTFQPNGPALDWTGWRWITFDLAKLDHAGHWGGPNDGVPHGDLRLDCPLLLDGASRKTSGAIHFAGLTFLESPKTLAEE